MDLVRAINITQETIINSGQFPYRTGQLKANFIDKGILNLGDNSLGFSVLSKPQVLYGKILENAPSIRYALRKVDKAKYHYIKHKNRHFRYIDKIIENEVLNAIEQGLGVRRV